MSDISVGEPLLSIVVPTRNRPECAIVLARSLARSKEPSFELVLHDNSDDDSLGTAIAELGDPRIRHIHSSEKMNMHENFTRAIDAARGAYLCGLGDDDGILIEPALRIVEEAQDSGTDAVMTARFSYLWPGLHHWLWGEIGGQTLPSVRPYSTARQIDPPTQVAEVFADATVNGLHVLPRIYHGIVSRVALDRLRERCGSYFPGGSPDMANAIGLGYCVNTLLYTPQAVIISGHSRKSGGGAGSAGKHHGKIEDQLHLPAGIIHRWPPAVPRYWSGHTIYAQSAIAAAEDSADRTLPEFAFARLYAACLVFDGRAYRKDIYTAMRINPDFGAILIARTAIEVVALLTTRARAFLASVWRYSIVRRSRRSYSDIEDLIVQLSKDKDYSDQ